MNLKTLKDLPPWEWPKGAGKMILKILRDDRADSSDRLLAAELAGDFTVINDELVDALLSVLCNKDASDVLRGQAAISLGPVLEEAYTDEFEDPDYIPITEQTFCRIRETLQKLYMDPGIPKEVRRAVLEASVRAPQDWHQDAIRAAYSSGDESWKLTAVFCMRFVRGFDDQIIEALKSENEDIHYQAVCAAGNWEVDAAWSHIAGLVSMPEATEKPLLLAAIEAVASIRPHEAGEILLDLTESDDEDIVDAAYEALALAGVTLDDDEEDDDDGFLH